MDKWKENIIVGNGCPIVFVEEYPDLYYVVKTKSEPYNKKDIIKIDRKEDWVYDSYHDRQILCVDYTYYVKHIVPRHEIRIRYTPGYENNYRIEKVTFDNDGRYFMVITGFKYKKDALKYVNSYDPLKSSMVE